MGFGKERNRIKDKIPSWQCNGYFGYGHGRAIREFTEKPLHNRSVCLDICQKSQECRKTHHGRMDSRFPAVAHVVHQAAQVADKLGRPVVRSVGVAMQIAESRQIPGTAEIRRTLKKLRIADMVDHYVCGQFENIQNGLDGVAPAAPCSLHGESQAPEQEEKRTS
jgi:hypothetical protein